MARGDRRVRQPTCTRSTRPGGGGDLPAQRRRGAAGGRREEDLRRRRPARAREGERERDGRDRAPAQERSSAASGCSRTSGSSRTRKPEVVEAEREKLARYRRELDALPGATAGSSRSRPWPKEFGLGRMRTLLAALGDPQRAYPAIHVVGTNGKSTATRTIEALLRAEGLRVGAYLSPHVARLGRADPRRRRDATSSARSPGCGPRPRRVGATQFEVLTAAAFAEFAAREVDVAVVEAGLGGRLDATNVLAAPVVLLTNVGARAHGGARRHARGDRAREARGRRRPARRRARTSRVGARSSRAARSSIGGAREAAAAFLGRAVEGEVEVALPGPARAARRRGLGRRAQPRGRRVAASSGCRGATTSSCASILRDKDVDGDARARSRAAADALRRHASSNPRALPAGRARRAWPSRYFARGRDGVRPGRCARRARARARPPCSSPARCTCWRTSARPTSAVR